MRRPSRTGENTELLLARLAGKLDSESAALLERHLEQCPSCRETLAAQQAVWDALEEWEPEAISPDFDQRLYRRIHEQERKSWWRPLFQPVLPFSLRPVLPAAAACLVLVAGLLIRGPGPLESGSAGAVESVDIEQVERVLQDLEMLHVLDPELRTQAPAARSL